MPGLISTSSPSSSEIAAAVARARPNGLEISSVTPASRSERPTARACSRPRSVSRSPCSAGRLTRSGAALEADSPWRTRITRIGASTRRARVARVVVGLDPPQQALGLVGRVGDQPLHALARLLEAAQHVGGDDLGIRAVGAPHADPDAPEVGGAEAAAEALQPVVAGQPAAELAADLAEGQVDLVVEDDDPIEGHPPGAARGPGGGPGP